MTRKTKEVDRKTVGSGGMGGYGSRGIWGSYQERKRPDYDHWLKIGYWTLEEAIHILFDMEPGLCNLYGANERAAPDDLKKMHRTLIRLERNIETRKLKQPEPNSVYIIDLLHWAQQQEIPLAKELTEFIEREGLPSESTPPYLDKKHRYYAEELAAAVRAWLAVYGSDNLVEKKGHKAQIEEWLSKEYKGKLSSNALKRVAMVANSNKHGGAPRSE